MTRPDVPAEPLPAIVAGSGPGLLLVHGAGGSPELNFPFLDDLAGDHRIVAPYLPGTGPAPIAIRRLDADDLADRLVATALEQELESFAVVGYSLGSALAIRATTRHPGRVRALVLTSGFAHARPSLRSVGAVWRSVLGGDPDVLAHFVALFGLAAAHLESLSDAEHRSLIETLSAAPPPPGTHDHLDLVTRIDVRADLAGIAVPTLVIATTADTLVAPAHSRELVDAIQGARYAEVDSGHLVAFERPAEWHAQITDFLVAAAA
jgi:pimeloyl-ACP methyl ester carboxylesterase